MPSRAAIAGDKRVAAAIALVQSHLERELSVVRRHVAALRSGGSYENVLPGDVDEALKAERPSELLVKGAGSSWPEPIRRTCLACMASLSDADECRVYDD